MLLLISPAKTLDMESPIRWKHKGKPRLLEDSATLIEQLKGFNSQDVMGLMGVSEKIADLNVDRFQNWEPSFKSSPESRSAIDAFKGDVYEGLDAASLNSDDAQWLQDHLRILSGLYGLLKPFDQMLPYRLEMGTKLNNSRGKNLYDFWGSKITELVQKDLDTTTKNDASDKGLIVNLASNEYFKAVKKKELQSDIVTPQFKDFKNGQYKMISFYAKRARGLMVRYIAQNRCQTAEDLLGFNLEGYAYAADMSKPNEPVFTRIP